MVVVGMLKGRRKEKKKKEDEKMSVEGDSEREERGKRNPRKKK